MHAQVLRSLHIGHASFLDQAHSLKLELAGKLPSLHHPPPVPSKHLTQCLRNRVQAKSRRRSHTNSHPSVLLLRSTRRTDTSTRRKLGVVRRFFLGSVEP